MTAPARTTLSLVGSSPAPLGTSRCKSRRVRSSWSTLNDRAKNAAVGALLATKTVRALVEDDFLYEARLVDRDVRTVKRWVTNAENQLRAAPDDIAATQLTHALFTGDTLNLEPELPLTRATVNNPDGSCTFYWPFGWRFEITPDMWSMLAGRPLWDAYCTDIAPRLSRPVSYTTFTRAFNRLPEEIRMGLRGGAHAAINSRVYLPQARGQLNDTWSVDLMFTNVRTAFETGARVFRPCWVSIRDEATDAYMAWQLYSKAPTTSDIIALFRRAIIGRSLSDDTFLGGVPRRVRCDQGTQLGIAFAEAGLHVGFTVDPTNNHSSFENGKQERSHQVARRTALDDLPGRTNGARDRTGQFYFGDSDEVLLFDEVAAILDRYCCSETEEAGATRTRGVTPAQLVKEHQAKPGWELRTADAQDLAWMSDDAGVYARRKSGGIEMGGVTYLLDLFYDTDEPGGAGASKKFSIGTFPDEPDILEIFTEGRGTWLGTANRAEDATADQKVKVMVGRARRNRGFEQALKEGEQRRHIRYGSKMIAPLGPVPKDEADMAGPDEIAVAESTPEPDSPPDMLAGEGTQDLAPEPGQPLDALAARLQASRASRTPETTP